MYKLIAFTYQSSPDELATISKWMGLTEHQGFIYNIPQHKVRDQLTDNCIVITFGAVPRGVVEQCIEDKKYKNTKLYTLQGIKQLARKKENTLARKDAKEKLEEVRDLLAEDMFQPTGLVIKDSDLPDLDAKHILLLNKITEENGSDSCFQLTKSGRLIEISNDKMDTSKADIHLTFQELYTIRLAMDVYGASEVKIVEGNTK